MASDHQAAVRLNYAIGASLSVADLMALTHREGSAMNLVNCVSSLQRAAKLAADGAVEPKAIEHVTTRALECFNAPVPGGLQTRHISGALWACAKLRVAPLDLICTVLQSAGSLRPHWFKPVEVSMAVWAIGRLVGITPGCSKAARQFVGSLLPFAMSRSQAFDTQGLSNLASGLSYLGVEPPELEKEMWQLQQAVRDRAHEFSPQEVANTLAAFAKLGVQLDECAGFTAAAGEQQGATAGM